MQEQLRSGWKSLSTALGQATKTAADAAVAASRAVAAEVVGARCLQTYAVGERPIATAGPGGIWKIYMARSLKDDAATPVASAWILDKRQLAETAGRGSQGSASQARVERALARAKAGVTRLARLKHPGMVRVVEPLEETRTQLVFVSEAVRGSLADYLFVAAGGGGGGPRAPPPRPTLSQLEVTCGLADLANTLSWLGNEASSLHGAVSPWTVLVSREGGWKLACLDFCRSTAGFEGDAGAGASATSPACFDYSDPDADPLSRPPLAYTAPERVATGATLSLPSAAADAWSLAALAVHAWAGRPLIGPDASLPAYEEALAAVERGAPLAPGAGAAPLAGASGGGGELWGEDVGAGGTEAEPPASATIPPSGNQVLRAMLSREPSSRPPAAAFAASAAIAGDDSARALRFLAALPSREPEAREDFLATGLPALARRAPARVLRARALPALLAQLSSQGLPAPAAEVALRVAAQAPALEFADEIRRPLAQALSRAPEAALAAVFQAPSFPSLTKKAREAALEARGRGGGGGPDSAAGGAGAAGGGAAGGAPRAAPPAAPSDGTLRPGDAAATDALVPVALARGIRCGDPAAAEAATRAAARVAADLSAEEVGRAVVPALRELALRTTSASARVASFAALASCVALLDPAGSPAAAVLDALERVLAVDASPPTAVAAVALGRAVAQRCGARIAAARVLPLLTPLLVSKNLTRPQFEACARVIEDVLERVKAERAEADGLQPRADDPRPGGRASPGSRSGPGTPRAGVAPGAAAAEVSAFGSLGAAVPRPARGAALSAGSSRQSSTGSLSNLGRPGSSAAGQGVVAAPSGLAGAAAPSAPGAGGAAALARPPQRDARPLSGRDAALLGALSASSKPRPADGSRAAAPPGLDAFDALLSGSAQPSRGSYTASPAKLSHDPFAAIPTQPSRDQFAASPAKLSRDPFAITPAQPYRDPFDALTAPLAPNSFPAPSADSTPSLI